MTRRPSTLTNPICACLAPFGTSIFTSITNLAVRTGAVNLSQGFPDFDGPEELRKIAAEAILKGPNQYSHPLGVISLREAVAAKMKRFYDLEICPHDEVTVTAGATEALAATLLGILNPGDEVILIEPSYDLYPAMVTRAGGIPVYVQLTLPDLELPREQLAAAFNSKTKGIIINNPQNPCGKVFSKEDLEFIANLCVAHDVIPIADEVYEHMVYDGGQHHCLLSVKGLRERAVVVSSTAKTFSMTGWKVGFTVCSPSLSKGIRAAHQFLTYCTPWMFQEAMAVGIAMDDTYYEDLLRSYSRKRELLCSALDRLGFDVYWPEGAYYVTMNMADLDFEDDAAFCEYLAERVGVAAIPESYFWKERSMGRDLVRLCFCKKEETLNSAIQKLEKWRG